jgi:hypothetical protein
MLFLVFNVCLNYVAYDFSSKSFPCLIFAFDSFLCFTDVGIFTLSSATATGPVLN